MSMQDTVSDMLTRVRNAQSVHKKTVSMTSAKHKVAIAEVLKKEGYIDDFSIVETGKFPQLEIQLKYFEGKPVIQTIKRVSRPGLRVYRGWKDLPNVLGGLGVAIISTSKGLMSDRAARKQQLGGEVLCYLT